MKGGADSRRGGCSTITTVKCRVWGAVEHLREIRWLPERLAAFEPGDLEGLAASLAMQRRIQRLGSA
jgi:hypothetical protein